MGEQLGGSSRGRHYVTLHILICLVHLCACPFEMLPQKRTRDTTGPGVAVSLLARKRGKALTRMISTTSRPRTRSCLLSQL